MNSEKGRCNDRFEASTSMAAPGRVLPATALARATAVQRTAGNQYQVAARAPYGSGMNGRQGWVSPTVATGGSTLGEAAVDDVVP